VNLIISFGNQIEKAMKQQNELYPLAPFSLEEKGVRDNKISKNIFPLFPREGTEGELVFNQSHHRIWHFSRDQIKPRLLQIPQTFQAIGNFLFVLCGIVVLRFNPAQLFQSLEDKIHAFFHRIISSLYFNLRIFRCFIRI